MNIKTLFVLMAILFLAGPSFGEDKPDEKTKKVEKLSECENVDLIFYEFPSDDNKNAIKIEEVRSGSYKLSEVMMFYEVVGLSEDEIRVHGKKTISVVDLKLKNLGKVEITNIVEYVKAGKYVRGDHRPAPDQMDKMGSDSSFYIAANLPTSFYAKKLSVWEEQRGFKRHINLGSSLPLYISPLTEDKPEMFVGELASLYRGTGVSDYIWGFDHSMWDGKIEVGKKHIYAYEHILNNQEPKSKSNVRLERSIVLQTDDTVEFHKRTENPEEYSSGNPRSTKETATWKLVFKKDKD